MFSRLNIRHIAKGVGYVNFKRMRWVCRFLFYVGSSCECDCDSALCKQLSELMTVFNAYCQQLYFWFVPVCYCIIQQLDDVGC